MRDHAWFFDTELLVLAERAGLRIHEVPVDWVDDPDSRVDLLSTALADLRGVGRLARGLATGSIPVTALRAAVRPAPTDRPPEPGLLVQAARFAVVGVVSTLAYLLLYLLLRDPLGAQPAIALSLLLTALGNTATNRRWTFGVRGAAGAARHQAQGLAVFGAALALTSGALAALHGLVPRPGRPTELGVLVTANLAATLLRFLALRGWVFGDRRGPPAPPTSPERRPANADRPATVSTTGSPR